MTGKMSVSIAMCTYSGGGYLQEQLESIANQSRLPDELIVCDDDSADKTMEILLAFKERSSFTVKVILNETKLGVVKNFEKAIKLCSGDIIFLADQDDVWKPNKIAECLAVFKDSPNAGYVFSNAEIVDGQLDSQSRDLWKLVNFRERRYRNYLHGEQLPVMLKGGNFIYGMTMAFKSEYKDILLPIVAPNRYSTCTHDTWISLILSSIDAYGVSIDDTLVLYRQHNCQQYGIGRQVSFFERMLRIKENKEDYMLELAQVLGEIRKRILSIDPGGKKYTRSIRIFDEMILHLTMRKNISATHGISKLRLIIAEIFSGRYFKFSSSFKSVIKDLMFS